MSIVEDVVLDVKDVALDLVHDVEDVEDLDIADVVLDFEYLVLDNMGGVVLDVEDGGPSSSRSRTRSSMLSRTRSSRSTSR